MPHIDAAKPLLVLSLHLRYEGCNDVHLMKEQ
jgi:hypothetical protein